MKNLKGRAVQINNDVVRIGEVIEDRGEQVVVYFPPINSADEADIRYIAKFRLLVSEYAFCDVPKSPGVYLIAKPIVEAA